MNVVQLCTATMAGVRIYCRALLSSTLSEVQRWLQRLAADVVVVIAVAAAAADDDGAQAAGIDL